MDRKTLADFGNETSDWIEVDTQLPEDVTYNYTWNELNRMTTATHESGGAPLHSATFDRTYGWQAKTVTLGQITHNYTYGVSGEVLAESIPNGIRTYINSGIDNILWSKDTAAGTNYWFNDINGCHRSLQIRPPLVTSK